MDEFFNFDAVIEIEKKKSYNQALEDFADEMLSVCAEYDSYILEIKKQLTK